MSPDHWAGCWREHLPCAITVIERLQDRIAQTDFLASLAVLAASAEDEQLEMVCDVIETLRGLDG